MNAKNLGTTTCTALGPHHGDRCDFGRVQAANAQFTVDCEFCKGTGLLNSVVMETTEPDHDFDLDTYVCKNCGITKKLAVERGPIVCPLEPSTAFDMLRKMDLEKMASADGVYDVLPPIKKEPAVLFPDGDFLFKVDDGKTYGEDVLIGGGLVIPAKANWPAHIRLQLNARDAFSFAVSLLNKLNSQIENGSFNDVCVEMTFPGSIKRLEPE